MFTNVKYLQETIWWYSHIWQKIYI